MKTRALAFLLVLAMLVSPSPISEIDSKITETEKTYKGNDQLFHNILENAEPGPAKVIIAIFVHR